MLERPDEPHPTPRIRIDGPADNRGQGLSGGRGRRALVRLGRLLERLPWLLPLLSFSLGWVGFFLFQRGEGLARGVAIVALLGWPWLLAENLLGRWLVARSKGRLSIDAVRFVTQQIQQEILFFALPFLFAAAVLGSAQAVFLALAAVIALVVTIDPLYFRRIAPHGGWSSALHGYCTFVAALVVLPMALHMPTDEALPLALAITAISLVLSLPRMILSVDRVSLRWGGCFALILVLAMGWQLRGWIPAAGLWVREAQIAPWVRELRPGPALTSVPREQLAEGLVAFVAVRAPAGLSQDVVFEWRHRGQVIDRIPAQISGGREAGFRSYSRKLNFPADPVGRWVVDLKTPSGQLVERLRFEVV